MAPRRVRPPTRYRSPSEESDGAAEAEERPSEPVTLKMLGELLESRADQTGVMHDRFMRQHQPIFSGRGDPEAAEDWVFRIQKIFRAIGVTPERMVGLTTYVLDGEASNWWRTTSAVVFDDSDDVSWEDFLAEFNQQYFPQHLRDRKREQFLALEQRDMTLAAYISWFHALERYCP